MTLEGALADVRVVEWGRGIAAGYAAKMLADCGARVTKLDIALAEGASGRSAECAAYLDERKTRADARDTEAILNLIAGADILISDFDARERIAAGIDRASLATINPRIVSVAITPFGLSGPYGHYGGGDLEVAFLAGLAALTPRDIARSGNGDDTPPLKMPGSLVSMYAGASAAGAALTALHGRAHTEAVQQVDVSMLESLIPTLRREIALHAYEGQIASRFMRVWRLAPWGVKRCRDGFVFLQVVERYHWQGLAEMMGNPAWSEDPRYLDADYRFEHRVDLEQRLAPWLLTRSMASFAWEAQRRELPFAPVNRPSDLLRIPQLHHRRFFRCATASDGRALVVPGVPFDVSAPAVAASGSPPRRARRGGATPGRRPLADLRVVDFGHVWAGPYCAAVLADMGAEVIKIESAHRLDIHRRQGPYPERRSGMNRSGVWNAQNRGKRSATLNLSLPRGRELACELVATADIVIENFAPGVMARLGLDYAALSSVNPAIVMASLSAFGQHGPQRGYVGYGPSLDAWAGLDALTAYRGGTPNALGGIFPDTGSALHAVVAILAALHERDRTGLGRYIDVSELEVSILLLADVVSEDLAGIPAEPVGNADRDRFPHGCYRCAGDDRWIALSVPDAAAWQALCGVLERGDWQVDAALASAPARRERAGDIDAAIAAWARPRPAARAMEELQAAGVPAGAAHDAATLLADPHLRARGFFATFDHDEVGSMTTYGPIWRFGEAPEPIDRPAPLLGADNDYVFGTLLGLAPEEIASLAAEKVIF